MDEFKPEDELKPDTSDRRPQRSRKTSSAPKVPVSRQYMMMGIGILVLLLLVIGIGSALNSSGSNNHSAPPSSSPPTSSQPVAPTGNSDKSIDLSGSSSMSAQQAASSPQELSAPAVSPMPTEAAPVQAPANQQRVELPGDLNGALANQQGQVDNAAQTIQDNASSLPTAQATVVAGARPAAATRPVAKSATNQPRHAAVHAVPQHQIKPAITHKPATVAHQPAKETKQHAAAEADATPTAPRGNYTLQLSSASRADSLNAWAKKQNLSSYHVYKTTRNGQPWYVLVSGAYAARTEAEHAVTTLPAEVRAQNPWVRSLNQVKKEASQ
ncbi:SPOR domain-containing protein [Erwinia tracheiphila]|uniref:Cell division protein DamX n=1 Tax=Erwinia tracheiphila TaxID=65700 RepID=A0A0M2KDZ6_9GAMM|nr:SPOR domain-containing protein [Erwinia tracheiphila]AXF78033.1 SPOR domain-containing protein [Erwinia tracheiphila]EOS95490.1 hypothetical protein ETR_08351 [Erwinia tracheiphila PSU-1]KKF37169.1 DamX [Erwinia tracheiphila]UIA83253.1 SPOR domain-containing protein [Erwinia tracheiphila]UIA88558.1 SPOR domain-containing protein [Erwinia tracheiphila]